MSMLHAFLGVDFVNVKTIVDGVRVRLQIWLVKINDITLYVIYQTINKSGTIPSIDY